MAAAGRVGAAAKVVDVPDAGVVVQAAIQSRRPYIYPLATIPQLVQNLKVGDKFKSQDDCKAVIGALAIFHNTPFRNFDPNRPTRVGARCICGESCSWGIRFAVTTEDSGSGPMWVVKSYDADHTGQQCAAATFKTHPYNPPYSRFLIAHTLLGVVSSTKKTPAQMVQDTLKNYLPYAVSASYCHIVM